MEKEKFLNVTICDIGQLYYEKVFFEGAYPIIFTCVDNRRNRYLCVCCQNNKEGRRWLISSTTPTTVIAMLRNQITLRDAFLQSYNVRVSAFSTNGNLECTNNDPYIWSDDSIYLPKEGETIDAEDGEFDEEISFYEGLLISVTLEFVIKTIKEAVISSVAYKMEDYEKNFHSSESATEITLKKSDDNSYVFVGHDGLNDAA